MASASSGGAPRVTDMRVVPVAGHDDMLMNLSGAHGPFFTRNIVLLGDSAGHTGVGEVPAVELVLRRLLPLAYAGLDSWGVDPAVRDRLLGVIEGRCTSGVNGASWQIGVVHDLQSAGADRLTALHRMLDRYIPQMHSNEPVHTWKR